MANAFRLFLTGCFVLALGVSSAMGQTYQEQNFGFDGCQVNWGGLFSNITLDEMINKARESNAKGFTYHPLLKYGKLMAGDFPAGCRSPKTDSWPLFLLVQPITISQPTTESQPNTSSQSIQNCTAQNITIQSGDLFATLTVTDNISDSSKVTRLVKEKVLACFKDDFDFIFFVQNSDDSSNFNQYNMSAVTNYSPASFGSGGRLKSVSVFPSRNNIIYGATLHEMAHTWANDILPTWGFDKTQTGSVEVFDSGSGSRDSRSGHWGLLTPGGQLGGFNAANLFKQSDGSFLVKQSFSTHRNNNSGMFSILELYLMGLAPENEVGTVTVYERPTDITLSKVKVDLPGGYYRYEMHPQFKATPKTYSVDDIKSLLNAKGTGRVPAYTSGKTFRVLPVLVSDRTVSATERTDLNAQLEWFVQPSNDSNFVG
ncbi:MAG: hypothetical protein D3906_12835, partial [Candidatus Electrothrix sp. AUS1_2]|nr:hypothetical protein [Candidatus Electrothrix sp. AUS1_2]